MTLLAVILFILLPLYPVKGSLGEGANGNKKGPCAKSCIHNKLKEAIVNILISPIFIFPLHGSLRQAVNKKRSVGTIVYHSFEALDCPLSYDKTIVPRLI